MELTRRQLLERAALGTASLAVAGSLAPRAGAATLPTAAQVRRDIQTMVDFGPRLTGNDAHNAYIAWLERQFVAAGCRLEPCDVYQTNRWSMESFGLEVAGVGPIDVASYFVRSQETPPGGVTGPLVYGGTLPTLALNGTDTGALVAAIERYPADVASWAQGVSGLLGAQSRGSVMVVDLPMPPPVTIGGLFGSDMTFYNGQGETVADLASEDYKRLWTVPGLALPLDSFTAMGVAGVVLIVDASYAALKGCYAPFEWYDEGVPALYVDRDTGRTLRAAAATRPQTRLTLTATRKQVPTPTVTAVLPGASEETLIFDTHTDGQGFVEENGGVALVHLARYFAQHRLRRTLVFAAWPGHMSNDLPQAGGWIKAHPDLVSRAAAALTIEHLGCTEWNDSTDQGYHPTGRPEVYAVWTTQGKMFELTRDAVVANNLPRTALMRPPTQFGVGGPFQAAGVPQIGGLAGPEYLLTVSENSDMDKLDAGLAARQIAWLADLARRIDGVSAADLRQGDPTLGAPAFTGNIVPSSAVPTEQACGPAPAAPPHRATRRLTMRYLGHGRVELDGQGRRVTVELRHAGRTVARTRPVNVDGRRRVSLRLRHLRSRRYTLVAVENRRVIARKVIRV